MVLNNWLLRVSHIDPHIRIYKEFKINIKIIVMETAHGGGALPWCLTGDVEMQIPQGPTGQPVRETRSDNRMGLGVSRVEHTFNPRHELLPGGT